MAVSRHQRLDDGLATRFKQRFAGRNSPGDSVWWGESRWDRWDRWDRDLEKAPALFPNFGLSNVGSGSTRIVMGNLVTSGLQRSDLRGLVEENIEQKLWAFSIPQNVVKAAIFFPTSGMAATSGIWSSQHENLWSGGL